LTSGYKVANAYARWLTTRERTKQENTSLGGWFIWEGLSRMDSGLVLANNYTMNYLKLRLMQHSLAPTASGKNFMSMRGWMELMSGLG